MGRIGCFDRTGRKVQGIYHTYTKNKFSCEIAKYFTHSSSLDLTWVERLGDVKEVVDVVEALGQVLGHEVGII